MKLTQFTVYVTCAQYFLEWNPVSQSFFRHSFLMFKACSKDFPNIRQSGKKVVETLWRFCFTGKFSNLLSSYYPLTQSPLFNVGITCQCSREIDEKHVKHRQYMYGLRIRISLTATIKIIIVITCLFEGIFPLMFCWIKLTYSDRTTILNLRTNPSLQIAVKS